MNEPQVHNLRNRGAAHDAAGHRIGDPDTIKGKGHAACTCGWVSPEPYVNGAHRKAAHTEHKAMELEAEPVEPEPVPDPVPAEPVETFRVPVAWPESVGRIFWRPMAKFGAFVLAESLDIHRESNELHSVLAIYGSNAAAVEKLAAELPALFMSANRALRQWRATSLVYKGFDLMTPRGRKDGWTSEQQFLEGWFWAVSGEKPAFLPIPSIKGVTASKDGIEAGRLFVAACSEVL